MTARTTQTDFGGRGSKTGHTFTTGNTRFFRILPPVICSLLMLGVMSGLMTWYKPVTDLSLVILSDDRTQSGLVTVETGNTNIGFIEKSGLFQRITRIWNTSDLEKLLDANRTENLVFYIDSKAWINASGKVLIPMIPESESSVQSSLDLEVLLNRLSSSEDRQVILVLNIIHNSEDFLDGQFREDLWPSAKEIIAKHTKGNLSVFIPDHKGLPELKIPGTRVGLFTDYFVKGLSGLGEETSVRPDGAIGIDDLFEYLRIRMDQWTRRYGYMTSEPLLFTEQSAHQAFCYARDIRQIFETSILSESYPATLATAWRILDRYRDELKFNGTPLLFTEFSERLVTLEKAWLDGTVVQEIDKLVDKTLVDINTAFTKFKKVPQPSFYSVAWYIRSGNISLDLDTRLESLLNTLGKLRSMTADPDIKESKLIELIDAESIKWKNMFAESKDYILQQAIVVEAASRHVWSSKYELLFLSRCVAEQSRELTIESEFLFQLLQILETNPKNDASILHSMFRNRVLRERLLARPEPWPTIVPHIRPVLLKLHEYDLVLRYTNHADLSIIKSEMDLIHEELKTYINDQDMVEESRYLISQSMFDLYWIPRLIQRFPRLAGVVDRYFMILGELDNRLEQLNQLSDKSISRDISFSVKNKTDNTLTDLNALRVQLSQLNDGVREIHEEIWQPVSDKAVLAELEQLKMIDINQTTINRLLELLEFPGSSASTREDARNFLIRFWKERTRTDDSQINRILMSTHPTANDPIDNSLTDNIKIKAFSLISKFVSPVWFNKEDFLKSTKPNSDYIDYPIYIENVEKAFDRWSKEELLSSEYSNEVSISKARCSVIYHLIYPFADSSNHLSEIYQNYRRRNQQTFYVSLGSLMDYFSIDTGGSSMLRQAAEEIRKITGIPRKVSVKIVADPVPINMETTSNTLMNFAVDMQLILSAIGEKQTPITVDVVNIAKSVLMARKVDELTLASDSVIPSDSDDIVNVKIDSRLNLQVMRNPVAPITNMVSISNPNLTLLLKSRIYDYEYHTPVSIYLLWPDQRPQLSFSSGSQPDVGFGMKQIRLRPIDQPTPLWIHVQNPSPDEMDLTVKMKIQSTLSNDSVEWISSPVKVKPASSARIPFQASQPDQPNTPKSIALLKTESLPRDPAQNNEWPGNLMPVNQDIHFTVIDNLRSQAGPLLQSKFKIRTASPTDVIQINPPVYNPKKRELKSQFFSRPEFFGTTPAQISMRIPVRSTTDPNSAVLSIGGNLTGKLEFLTDKKLDVVSSPVIIDPLQNGYPGRFYFDIDRFKRAYVYQTRWMLDYDRELAPIPILQPEIRMRTEKIWRNGVPIPITFEPINEPENSFIVLEVASVTEKSSENLNYREVQRFESSRQERFAVRFEEKIGTILISNGMQDWTFTMPTTGLIGRVSLRARLQDPNGKVLATDTNEILLDDQPVRQANLVDIPDFVKVGNRVKVRLQVVSPPSGLKQVLAVLGPVKDRKIPESASQVRLTREVSDTRQMTTMETWSGELAIPAKAEFVGNSIVTVILETGSGLTEEVKGDLKIVAADYVEFGTIQGLVTQGTYPQPDLPVVLRKMDAKRTEVARVKTDRQGKFQIPAIAPGRYGIFTAKSADQTSGQAEVLVKSGQTSIVPLSLGRVNLPSNGPTPKPEPMTSEK